MWVYVSTARACWGSAYASSALASRRLQCVDACEERDDDGGGGVGVVGDDETLAGAGVVIYDMRAHARARDARRVCCV